MTRRTALHRRTFLRGVGASMGLPLLDAMRRGVYGPNAYGAESKQTQSQPSTSNDSISNDSISNDSQRPPVRMAFLFVPNGVIVPSWKVAVDGEKLQLSPTLQPLEKHRSELLVFSGLTQNHGRANGDGAGDHARSASSFLTGAQPRKTSAADIQAGISADQAGAAVIGKFTRLPSLELGIERGRNAGSCDSGYSCAYSSNVSWKTASTPMAKEINPRLAFERLFPSTDEKDEPLRDLFQQSILDLVSEDASRLRRQLGKTDQRKLDEYFTSVRELELRLAKTAATRDEVPEYDIPEGIPRELDQHLRLMSDILVLAFQTDTTRIGTYMLANAGSNRSYPMVDVRSGHHGLSHHRNNQDTMREIAKIDHYLVSQYAYLVDRLASVKEGEGTLLDNCMVLYGSGLGDGNRHTHHDLPILLAGRGGGTINPGRHLVFPKDTPLNNLFVAMCKRVGANVTTLGDSTGELPRLA